MIINAWPIRTPNIRIGHVLAIKVARIGGDATSRPDVRVARRF